MSKPRRARFLTPRLTVLEDRLVLSSSRVYVDALVAAHSPSAVRDGSSWATAFDNLQAALDEAAATPGDDQIWIAEGTYRPTKIYAPLDAGSTPVPGGAAGLNVANLKTFDLPDGVSLYGGFAYGMKSLGQRSHGSHPTVLSGDLSGNDVADRNDPGYAASKADNAWHVVTLGNDVVRSGVRASLDGLIVINGYAAGPNNGGTLSPFVWGHADGGGVYSTFGSDLTIDDSLFFANFAASDGGGVFSDGSDLTVSNSDFIANAALVRAGALEGLNDFEIGSHKTIVTDCLFAYNTSEVFGGAVVGEGAYQGPESSMIIDQCEFVSNRAAEGGAVVVDTLPVLITRSTFRDNTATVTAGALATTNVVATLVGAPNHFETTISHCEFENNVAIADPAAHAVLNNFVGAPGLNFGFGGGALLAYMNGFLNVDHSSFVGNRTTNGDGGAILNGNASANLFGISAFAVETNVFRCDFEDNAAPNGVGGAVASKSDGLSPTSTAADTAISILESDFDRNRALRGGAVHLGDSTATILNNSFQDNLAGFGSAIYGTASEVNGFASSDPNAAKSLKKRNRVGTSALLLS